MEITESKKESSCKWTEEIKPNSNADAKVNYTNLNGKILYYDDNLEVLIDTIHSQGNVSFEFFLQQTIKEEEELSYSTWRQNIIEVVGNSSCITSIKTVRNKHVYVATNSIEAAYKIAKLQVIDGKQIRVNLNVEAYASKFVANFIDIEDNIESISSQLIQYGIPVIKIVKLPSNDKSVTPACNILVVQLSKLIPETIQFSNQIVQVRQFYEKVIQCRICKKYGHSGNKKCYGSYKCVFCSGAHNEVECRAVVPKCSLCMKDHCANNTSCSSYQKEVEIVRLRNTCLISRFEAVSIVQGQKSIFSTEFETYQKLNKVEAECSRAKICGLEEKVLKLEQIISQYSKFDMEFQEFKNSVKETISNEISEYENECIEEVKQEFAALISRFMDQIESSLSVLRLNSSL